MSNKENVYWDIHQIKKVLPHRYPFLLVDRLISFEKGPVEGSRIGSKAVGIKNVSANEQFFNGHFPENPVMPGVLILEALAQAGACSCFADFNLDEDIGVKVLIAKIQRARFRKPVVPGDQLVLETEIIKEKGKILTLTGVAKVDGEEVASTEVLAHVDSKVKG